ncbi:hypothetical protein [Yinghuangia seranimata]|uniref:hypothetical protein n=1 Tax=Yinghuangia seranimata TaxID=408067 RepID=UPI00248CED2F|nr:hypothetical protein [Yinghuangia seranimata]MDI2128805.1 hypothetical protein [Yinghuangia seranimata]
MSTLPPEPPRKPATRESVAVVVGPAVLALEVRRLADRFRHLSESRLAARIDPDDPSDPTVTRAGAGLALARRLAELGDAPEGLEPGDVGPFAVGDQIAVTGLDLVALLETEEAAERGSAASVLLEQALGAVRELAARGGAGGGGGGVVAGRRPM